MPTWGDILAEISKVPAQPGGPLSPCDFVRRKYLAELHHHRQRATILYATKWTQAQGAVPPEMISITDEDVQGLMTVMHGIRETALDLVLHSPGGSLEAAEAVVTYLRSKFTDICVIVPQQAMSAATAIACGADTIVLGKHSFLGPVDPQLIVQTESGSRAVSAQNVEDEFERAQKECADPAKMGAWIPILKQYAPGLLETCRDASKLSRTVVAGWLQRYMFRGYKDAKARANRIARWLSPHKELRTHGRHLSREDLRAKGMDKVIDLEDDPRFQDLALSVFHAATLTFDYTPAVKLIENHSGKAFIKLTPHFGPGPVMLMAPPGPQPLPPPVPSPSPQPPPPPSPAP